jgi:hypothetical protein
MTEQKLCRGLAFFAAKTLVSWIGGFYETMPTTTFWLLHAPSAPAFAASPSNSSPTITPKRRRDEVKKLVPEAAQLDTTSVSRSAVQAALDLLRRRQLIQTTANHATAVPEHRVPRH